VRATATNLPGSIGGFSGQLFDYDVMGRLERSSNPTETDADGPAWAATGEDAVNGWLYSVTSYDWKGRPLVEYGAAAPGATAASTKEYFYGGCGCAGGGTVLTRDEVGRRQKTFSDVLGRSVKMQLIGFQPKSEALSEGTEADVQTTTTTVYDPLDQPTSITVQAGTNGPAQVTTSAYDGHGRLQSEHNPRQDAGTATVYSYYADDAVKTITDARGAVATFGYNSRHLVESITYSGAPLTAAAPVTYDYDAAGNRVLMDDGPGQTTYGYDMLSRLTSETRDLGVGSFSFGYTYNLADQLETVTDSNFGTSFTSKYDAAGRVNLVNGTGYGAASTPFLKAAVYRAWGAARVVTYGNDRQMVAGYDKQLRVSRMTMAGVMDKSFNYFSDGRIAYSQDFTNSKRDRSYQYDEVGRRTAAFSGFEARPGGVSTEGWGPYRQTYGYDTWGNMTSRTWRTWFTTPTGSTVPQGNSYTATFNLQNRQTSSTTSSSASDWQYDAEGNLIHSVSGTSQYWYGYDRAGRLVDTVQPNNRTTLQTYDGDGARVAYFENGTPTYYVRSAAVGGQVLVEVNSSGQKLRSYIYTAGKALATQEGTGSNVRWEHRDPTNVSIYLTFAGSPTVAAGEYDPLGVPAPDVPGITFGYNPPYNSGSFGTPDMSCTVDRIPTSCDVARRWIASGIGVPCKNNDCGSQRYETPEGDALTKPYQCFADGYCDYLPPGVSYVGDGYVVETDLGSEHVRFKDITNNAREGLIGNFMGTWPENPDRKRRRKRRDTSPAFKPAPRSQPVVPKTQERNMEQRLMDCQQDARSAYQRRVDDINRRYPDADVSAAPSARSVGTGVGAGGGRYLIDTRQSVLRDVDDRAAARRGAARGAGWHALLVFGLSYVFTDLMPASEKYGKKWPEQLEARQDLEARIRGCYSLYGDGTAPSGGNIFWR
jgi:YD repeat-containing protein